VQVKPFSASKERRSHGSIRLRPHLPVYLPALPPRHLRAHPNHALTDAWSAGATHKIVILSPESELKRRRIYFLIPSACSAPAAEMRRKH